MLRSFFHRLVPASRPAGQTAFSTLSRIDLELRHCSRADVAVRVLNKAKPHLCSLMRERFGSPAAEALTLKILNLFLTRYHLESRSGSVLSRPFGLVMDTSNACQLACPGCVHSSQSEALHRFVWPNGTLPERVLSAFLKCYGPWAIAVNFYNYGEPLLNLNTPKFIRMAKNFLLTTSISTSLSVRRFDTEAYVESGLDHMELSIDGATQAVYQRFRRNGDLELVMSNIRKLVEAKRVLGKSSPVLSWNFLAFEHNVHEIPDALRMAGTLGVDQFRVVNPFEVSWDDPEIRPAKIESRIYRLDRPSVVPQPSNWNPFSDSVDEPAIMQAFDNSWIDQVVKDSPPSSGHTCHWLYKNIVMDATGRIMPCCGAPRPDINLVFGAFDGKGGDSFNSEKYRQARDWFAGRASPTGDDPHCTCCEWDQTTANIGGPEIRGYFEAADEVFFDYQSVRLLSNW